MATLTNDQILKINGSLSLKVSQLVPGFEPIYSSNAGRSSTGKFIGDIVAWKDTVTVTFCNLTEEEGKQLYNALHRRTINVQYRHPQTKALKSITCYGASFEMPVYSFVEGYPRIVGMQYKFVEE